MSIVEDARQLAQGAMQGAMAKAVALAPDSWVPGGKPDPLIARQHGHVGKPVSRLDGPLKVSGTARFAAEFSFDNMVYGALVYSTIAKGRIVEIDTGEAEAAPGVVTVMTHRNAPRLNPPPVFLSNPKAAGGDTLPVMQDDRIHWNGEPVAVVLAQTQEQADHAASLIRVRYAEETALLGFEEAKARGTRQGLFMGPPLHNEIGEAEAALAAAPVKVDATYRTPRHNHNAIELHAVTVAWQGETLRVHDASQLVAHTAWSMAQIFGIDAAQVVITSPFVGGGFGGKCMWQHHILAAAAAKVAGRPVRLVLSREGVYRIVGGRSLTEQRVALGASPDGKLKALIHTGTTAKTADNVMPEPFIMPTRSAYAAETMLLDVQTVELDMLANTFMRAPGEAVGTFALESAIDELAEALAIDPIELRMRNDPEKDPISGLPFSSHNLAEAYRAGAERFGWGARAARPGAVRDGEWLVGMGCATGTYPYYRMPGGAARITLRSDGHATIDIAAHEMGMGTATAQTQVAADRLGLELDAITFNYGDSTLPGVVLAGGSQQTASIGASVIAAHHALVKELLKTAGNDSPLAGLEPDQVASRDGGLCKLDDPARYESYASILRRAQRDTICVEASPPQPLETMHWSMHSHCAMFCEVRVNAVTGEPRVSRFLGSFDCGRILNPKTASSQFRGGIIMGLGLALMEETLFDERNGRIMNPSLADYHVPVHMDVPDIDVIWTDIADPHTPMGAHGIGEIGITGTGAAIANAIYNATGKRVRDLPITLDKLL
ncbi:xanthine dehydrogenase YagR molybdenum-binding subunit [Sphingomonas naasensis]|uniref:Xanthine dehydrogenase family protein molybdopterin-binding subunit n=1 Tax=Sphingomonas naasensis TaxID=1344951 RepID=A0A4S1W4Q3_9SPHN|nr:xanthine dehydrogenase family protein molybdopterin-binding subunit [Sphingomonas naasensis]NIJ20677.1 xanthine dehydrogenase YagR molybdenum-binding subunit [Sphingomonas naasensis]TGX37599.1 xanthine dehydrogenase family protein molybdopterin-binding subunit [Sphingomonas naasensis]